METALLAALERVNPAETLIVVTADHGHVMTFGGQATPRGHPVLGTCSIIFLASQAVISDIKGYVDFYIIRNYHIGIINMLVLCFDV